jgi:hypothetical protein
MHLTIQEHPEYKLYITDNPGDDYLDEFIWGVVTDSQVADHLIDNPYTYQQLKALKFKYAILWLKDDIPFYGFFITQYNQLPPNIARFYVRMYTIDRKNNPLGLRFIKHEHDMYAKHLAPLLRQDGIDTMFFTRHSDAVEGEKKYDLAHNNSKGMRWWGYVIHNRYNQKFKGIKQNIHYFNAWQPDKELDDSFLNQLGDV